MEKYTDSKCQIYGGKIIMHAFHLLKKLGFRKILLVKVFYCRMDVEYF